MCSPPHVRVGRVRVLHAVVDGIDDGAAGAVERGFHGSDAFEWPAAAVEPAQSERAVGRGDSERGLGLGPGRMGAVAPELEPEPELELESEPAKADLSAGSRAAASWESLH